MKNKGFTLIELLAVIVVLAVIALIATPIIMDIIEDGRRGVAERSVDNYLREIEVTAVKEMKFGRVVEGTYVIQPDGSLCNEANITSCINVDMSGKKPHGGKVLVKDAQVSQVGTYVQIDDYSVVYKDGKLKVRTWVLTGDMDLNGSADIGDLITIGTESFYVYSNDGNEIKALAQYNLKVGAVCPGWYSCEPISKPTGLQDPQMLGYRGTSNTPWYGATEFSKSSNDYDDSVVKKYVDEYNSKLKKLGADNITTRLITENELKELGAQDFKNSATMKSSLPENKHFIYSTSYWTSTPYPATSSDTAPLVVIVYFHGRVLKDVCTATNSFGVRPVVIIPASEV